jgi:hypothetical protein
LLRVETPVEAQADHEALDAATGVALVAATGVEPDDQAAHVAELEAATGVDEQEVEVLVQTGTEIVHGQSVMVRVVVEVIV